MMLNSKYMQPLDIFACNSVDKPSFQNPTKDLLLAELQAKMPRGCRFFLLKHHSYEVTLRLFSKKFSLLRKTEDMMHEWSDCTTSPAARGPPCKLTNPPSVSHLICHSYVPSLQGHMRYSPCD